MDTKDPIPAPPIPDMILPETTICNDCPDALTWPY